jgi:hypothetical protein
MRFCWRRNWAQIRSSSTRFADGAKRRGVVFHFNGALGVLAAGAEQGLVDVRAAVDRLRQTSFYISLHILDRLTGGR